MALIETIPVKDDYRRKLAYKLMMEGIDASPIQHWAQGLARMGQSAIGGYEMYQADKRDKETEAANYSGLAAALERFGGGASPAMPTPQKPTVTPSQPVTSVTPSAGTVPAMLAGDVPAGKVMPKTETNPNGGMYGGLNWRPVDSEPPPEPVKTAALSPAAAPVPAPAPVPTPTEPEMNAAKAKLAQMVAILRDPSVSPQEKKTTAKMAEMLVGNLLQGDKPTDEVREFQYAEKNPAFKQYKIDLKRAGAIQNQVMIDQKGEGEFSKEAGKAQAKRFDELASEGQKARQMVSDIETLTELGKNIGTGKGAEITARIGPWAESIGVPIKGLSDIQAFEAIANRVAPSLRVPGSGAQSDFELKNFLKSIPALGNTPEGNAIVGATMKGLQENKIRAAEIGSRALNGEITRPQAEKMLRELPDPMENFRAYEKANKAKASSSPNKDALKKKYGLD